MKRRTLISMILLVTVVYLLAAPASITNPFNPITSFSFFLNRPVMVKIDLYSVAGRHLETVLDQYCQAGQKEVYWNCSAIPSGVYFARISTPFGNETRKVVILQ